MNLFKKIDHIELVVGNFESAKKFYEKLGPKVRETTHHGSSAEFLIGDTLFEIHQVGGGGRVEENPGLDHISFLVEGGKDHGLTDQLPHVVLLHHEVHAPVERGAQEGIRVLE